MARNSYIEEQIVCSFVTASRKERILHELSSKKRRTCIWKLCKELFDQSFCLEIDRAKSVADILVLLKNKGAQDDCYVMSIDERIDGAVMPLEDALEAVFGYGPALVSCSHGKLAYLECERESGAPERIILNKKD